MSFFSNKNRAPHLGPYPLERLARQDHCNLDAVPAMQPLSLHCPDTPHSIVNAMRDYQAMLDAIRIGFSHKVQADCPEDLLERANHFKALGYFCDAAMVGVCAVPQEAVLQTPIRNDDVDRLIEDLQTKQTSTLASGIDLVMADLRESTKDPKSKLESHSHALVFLYEYPRDPENDEVGGDWIQDAQQGRACLRASETAVLTANYMRLLGYDARAHCQTTSDLDLNKLAVAAGLVTLEEGRLLAPYIGERFGVAVVSTQMPMQADKPLVAAAQQPRSKTHGWAWKIGKGFPKSASHYLPYKNRRYVDGAYPFEKLKRVDEPTTYIDEERVARVPKRADMFARAQFGDMGKANQKAASNGYAVCKSAPSTAYRRILGAFILLQDDEKPAGKAPPKVAADPRHHAELIKATSYFLGIDAVGISRCPSWAWYSHDALGEPIIPHHDQAISMLVDQGFETLDGSSGDDWISVTLSMRAYLRFALLGGVIAKQIQALGYSAKVHSVMDGNVLQPPLLLLSGLGEVSRIGEVVLNPFMGPRLKSGVITTDLPLEHDKPIDFGMQKFCNACNKCARECPSGAITAGPKLMFNGYEIWKSDSQKCLTYRIGAKGGSMCGRCMKTCPWNLEGLFAEKPFRWAAMNVPQAAPLLAKLDDVVGNGECNDVKKWWWDLELQEDGSYLSTQHAVNRRALQKDFDLKYKDQTLAVYPANLAPHPWPFPFPADREKGIEAYQAMVTAQEYKAKIAEGKSQDVVHEYKIEGDAPVIRVEITRAEKTAEGIIEYEFSALDGKPLPQWSAGAHIDIVVAPEFLRQYSLTGDPTNRNIYQIGVLKEEEGRGGSNLLHRIFTQGRKIFISKPINHFPLDDTADVTFLMGGGIGITPMIAMGYEAEAKGMNFSLHYSAKSRKSAGFIEALENVAWKDKVHFHFSDEGQRADLDKLFAGSGENTHVYTCGPEIYMQAVLEAAQKGGMAEDNCHFEYFTVPEMPEYENHDFTLKLVKSGRTFLVPADKSATDVLLENNVHVDVKCSDGICGVCQCGLVGGEVEHRDFVLSNKQREKAVILCQSRALKENGVLEVDL